MKKLTCLCCGAPINRAKQKCEYCGTEYIIQDETLTINVESFTNPVEEYTACTLVPDEFLKSGGQEAMEYAIHQLAKKMLPAVVKGMRVSREYDPFENKHRLRGNMRIVIPEHSF